MSIKIRAYKQVIPQDILQERPQETWRCDLYPNDMSRHHGIGATESEAVLNAALSFHAMELAKRKQVKGAEK